MMNYYKHKLGMMPWLIKLGPLKGRECQDQFVVTGMNGGFVKEGTVFTELDKFMTPEMIEKLYQRMNFVDEFDSSLFGGVLKMSMVVGEEQNWIRFYKKLMICLMVVFELFPAVMAVLTSYKMGFIKRGD